MAEELVPQKKQGESWGSPVSSPISDMKPWMRAPTIPGKVLSLTPSIGRSSWLVLAERREGMCITPALSWI